MDAGTIRLVKERNQDGSEENNPRPLLSREQILAKERARDQIPRVFDHQYAEYISGLKPPYLRLGLPVPGSKEKQGQESARFYGD